MERRPGPATERPRAEPEIIPPERRGARPHEGGAPYYGDGAERIYVGRVGPLGFVLLALTIAILTAVVFVVLMGAFLIALPLALVLLVVALFAGAFRRRPR